MATGFYSSTQAECNYINEFHRDGVEINESMYMDWTIARDWMAVAQSEEDKDIIQVLGNGLFDLTPKQRDRMTTLLTRALDDISADNLLELRDLLRSIMFDCFKHAIISAAKDVENEYEDALSPTDYACEHGVHLQGDPLTGGLK